MKKNEPLFLSVNTINLLSLTIWALLLHCWQSMPSFIQLRLAMMAFIVSGICDLFDGVVARRMKRTESQKRFGN